MANKNRFTQEQVIRALVESRGLISIAARKLACEQQTVRNYAARYPKVQQVLDDQRDTLVDSAELRLVEAVEKKGEQWAIALVLRTLGRNRGYVERVEQTGKDGGPIAYSEDTDMSKLSNEALRTIIAGARARGISEKGISGPQPA